MENKTLYLECGSDEVGTGDYFGPVIVCAACIGEEHIEGLRALGIKDSKAISDNKIRKFGKTLRETIPNSLLILDNRTYNEVHKDNNMVAIKAKLHNKAYVNLKNKLGSLPEKAVVDQFAEKAIYFNYLQDEKEVYENLQFETKAESKHLAVAVASVIARYTFLEIFDLMERHYNFTFPKGASTTVDVAISTFVDKFGKEELEKVAKLHFANTAKARV